MLFRTRMFSNNPNYLSLDMTARFLSRNSLLKILQKIHLILVKKLLVACFCFIGCLDVLTSCNSLKMLIRVSE
jgi:hypothetical protein